MDVVNKKEDIKRIRTYIHGLDEHMEYGVPEEHVVLVSGGPGTMKSSLCFNVLYNEALRGNNSIYISLEQSHQSLINHMINMGLDMTKINLLVIKDLSTLRVELNKISNAKTGTIILVDVGCIRKEIKDLNVSDNKSWMNVIKNIAKKIRAETQCKVFVMDSLAALYVLSRFENPRIEVFYFFEFLRDLKMTSLLVSEGPPDHSRYGQFETEDFLADGIIQLKLTPFRRNIVREINIVKMRATKCNNDVFSLEVKNGQFHALYGGQNPLL